MGLRKRSIYRCKKTILQTRWRKETEDSLGGDQLLHGSRRWVPLQRVRVPVVNPRQHREQRSRVGRLGVRGERDRDELGEHRVPVVVHPIAVREERLDNGPHPEHRQQASLWRARSAFRTSRRASEILFGGARRRFRQVGGSARSACSWGCRSAARASTGRSTPGQDVTIPTAVRPAARQPKRHSIRHRGLPGQGASRAPPNCISFSLRDVRKALRTERTLASGGEV